MLIMTIKTHGGEVRKLMQRSPPPLNDKLQKVCMKAFGTSSVYNVTSRVHGARATCNDSDQLLSRTS